ncbi:MAG: hypothetical protein AAF995_08910 [Planctomycetota bacterium]
MFRSILAGVIGYLAMALAIMVLFTAAFLALGADRAFQPGTFDTAPIWLAVWGIGSIAASLLGGFICAKLAAPSSKAPVGLAVAVVILGLVTAFANASRPDPGPRDANLSTLEAGAKATQPAWTVWAQPAIGALGVLAGARLGRKTVPARA